MKTTNRDGPAIAALLVFTATACFAWGMSAPKLSCPTPRIYVVGGQPQIDHRRPISTINNLVEGAMPHAPRP
jgi:hypothetical protein